MSHAKKHGRFQISSRKEQHYRKAPCSKSSKTCLGCVPDPLYSELVNIPKNLQRQYSVKNLAKLQKRHQLRGSQGEISLKKLFSALPSAITSMKKSGRCGKLMEDLVLKCYPMLDDMLFQGMLSKSNLKVQFIDNSDDDKHLGNQHERRIARGSEPFIYIYRVPGIPPFHDHYFRAYLGTMAHEMIHAFFAIYQCRETPKCIKANNIQEGEFGNEPGHGPAFELVEGWLADVSRFFLEGIDLQIDNHENLRIIPDDYSKPEDEVICQCAVCKAGRKWVDDRIPDPKSYEQKWKEWLDCLEMEAKIFGKVPEHPDTLPDGLAYEFIPGEGYTIPPPNASRKVPSEKRNNIILDMSKKQLSRYRDKVKELRKEYRKEDEKPYPVSFRKIFRRRYLKEFAAEPEDHDGGDKARDEKLKRKRTMPVPRKQRIAETGQLMDETYKLRDPFVRVHFRELVEPRWKRGVYSFRPRE